jgi:hypothetical protein
MPTWKVRFKTQINFKEFRYWKNIPGYLEKKLTRFGTKVVAIESEISGNKAIGYTLSAVVTYEAEKETYPRFFDAPVRWKPIYDESKWRARMKRNVERAQAKENEEQSASADDDEEE